MRTSSSDYCVSGRFYGTTYLLLLVRIYPISYDEDHQIRSEPLPHFLALEGVLAKIESFESDVYERT
jgi:hypothetical protein